MKKLITLILIACNLSGFSQVYKTVTMALDTGANVAKLRAGTQTYNLTDSLSNYTPLQDGLISGGNATIGTGSVTIDTAYYRINKVNHMSLPRTFTGISNSASGTQYYILVYGKSDNTLDTLQGVQDTIATIPTKPNGTVSINTVLVGDGGVVSSSPDLSGYWKLIGDNNAIGNQIINGNLTLNNNNIEPTIIVKSDVGAYTSRLNMYYSGAGSSDINAKSIGNTLRFLVNDTLISQYGDNYANFYKDINLTGKDFLKNGSKLSANDVDSTSIRTVLNSFNKSESDIRFNPNLGYTPYNPSSYPVNSGGETLGSSANRGNTISQSNSGAVGIQISSTNASSYASTLFYGTTAIGANSSFDFIGMYANSVPKFIVNGLGNTTANSFIKSGGTSSQFLKADGSSDGTGYAPLATSQALTDGATITWDVSSGSIATVTLAGNRTLAITNAVANRYYQLTITQDATGSRTITLPAGSKVISGGAGAIMLTATASAKDILTCFYDGTNYYWNIGHNYN